MKMHTKVSTAQFKFGVLVAVALIATAIGGCDERIRSSATPSVEVVPERFAFAKVQVQMGDEPCEACEDDKIVEIRNVGTGDLLISRMVIDGANVDGEFALFWKTEAEGDDRVGLEKDGTDRVPYPVTIPGGTSLFLVLNYKPKSENLPSGKVVLTTNLPTPVLDIPIQLSDADAQIAVSPRAIDFGKIGAGEVKEERVSISNPGQVPVEVRKILLNGSQDFVPLIDDDGTKKDPRRLERDVLKVLQPDEQMFVTIRYAPQSEGDDTGQLVVSSNDARNPNIAVNLSANGSNPCLKAEPSALEFLTSLVNRTDSRRMVLQSCGGESVEITRVYLKEGTDANGRPYTDPAFRLPDQVDEGGDALEWPVNLAAWGEMDRNEGVPPPTTSVMVEFTPTEQRIHNGILVIESNDPVTPEREVSLLGRGVENACPQARSTIQEVTVEPLDIIELDGSPSVDQDGPDNKPIQYTWVITERPMGSTSQPVESFFNRQDPVTGGPQDDVSTPTASFYVDMAGTYTAELRVTDNLGLSSVQCDNAAVVTIIAKPEEAILVQLSWRTPNDMNETDQDGTDLDLHLLHPNAQAWGSVDRVEPYDCYFKNPTPDWGQIDNEGDNPSLDIDDLNGSGPENVTLAKPENTMALRAPYLVGVQYYRSIGRQLGEDYGASYARLRIYLRGELAWEYEGQQDCEECQPGERKMEETGHFWDVASIDWPGQDGQDQITVRDRYYRDAP